MSTTIHNETRTTFWTLSVFYFLIAFEFFYMASPFALYFYSVYGPSLNFINRSPLLSWLSSVFLPHITIETKSTLLNYHNEIGGTIFLLGLLGFMVGAIQVYANKILKRGVAISGIYQVIRHPQYASLAISSFGLLILWPRFMVLVIYIAMLFAYYSLAKIEEAECERKFGQDYLTYKAQTNMFLPFRIPIPNFLILSSQKRWQQIASVLVRYIVITTCAIGGALLLQRWSIRQLYTYENQDHCAISVSQIDHDRMSRIFQIASSDSTVLTTILTQSNNKYLDYILPICWSIPEIPMNAVNGNHDHLFPADYDRNKYKIIFTKATLRTNKLVFGLDIISNTIQRSAVGEVWIDLVTNKVTAIKAPPSQIMYDNIPVPLF